MWKLMHRITRICLCHNRNASALQVRFFLSESFAIENVWNDRLKSPILKRINTNDLFNELDGQFQRVAYASAIDIDLFVNALNDEYSFDEVEEVVHKLRLSPEAINILPSTQHALIRLYMKFNKTDDLMRILDDRLNYGIFPDDYACLLLMDNFIKESNFRDACKVSTLCMLQEDFSNILIKYMALYSCHKYLENPTPWNIESNEPVESKDDEEEEVKVRVKYIRNPYFDDHFDIVEPKNLIGKTLTMIGTELDDHVGRTYTLLGLILHNKLELAKAFVLSLAEAKENGTICQDGLNLIKNMLEEMNNAQENKDKIKDQVNELITLLSNTPGSLVTVEGNLLSEVESKIEDLVTEIEDSEIKNQLQVYKEWENNRKKVLDEHMARLNREKHLAEIEQVKQKLREKEEELFFFENEDKLDLIIEEKEKMKTERLERENIILEARKNLLPVSKRRKIIKPKVEPPLESYLDENIPMKLIKTNLD